MKFKVFAFFAALFLCLVPLAAADHCDTHTDKAADASGDDRGLAKIHDEIGYDPSFGMESPEAAAERMKREKKYKEWDERAAKEAAERQARLDKLNKESLERRRKYAHDRIKRFDRGHEGKQLTPEEQAERDKLEREANELDNPTAEETAKSEAHQKVRNEVVTEIRQTALHMGKLTPEEIAEREQAHRVSKAATAGWGNWTFTGRAKHMVEDGIFRSREQGIFANNMIIAADVYLNKPGITQEQREIAQEVKDRNIHARGAAATHIVQSGAVVMGGTAGDVATLGVGKLANKIAGYFGGQAGTQAATEAGVQAGTKVGATEAGAQAGAKLGGTEAGAQAGAKLTGTEAGAQAGTKAAGTEAGSAAAGQGVKPTTQQMAQQQAAHDAKAAAEAGKNWRAGNNPQLSESVVMPAEAAAAQAELAAIKQGANKLSQAEMNALFKEGANLTPNQIIQKGELLQQGFRAGPGGNVVPPGAMGQGVAPGVAPGMGGGAGTAFTEGATQVGMPAAGQAASGGTTQAFNKVLPTPGGPGVAPNVGGGVANAATEGATQVGMKPGNVANAFTEGATQVGMPAAGQAASGGTTQAFNKVLPTPGGPGVAPNVGGGVANAATEGATQVGMQGGKGVAPNIGGGVTNAATEGATQVGMQGGKGATPTAASEAATQVNMGKTQGFNQVLQTPGQQSASGGTTQAFNQVLPTPAGKGVAPNVGGGVTSPYTEAATQVGMQGGKGVAPNVGGGVATPASEAATQVGFQGGKGVAPGAGGGAPTAASEAATQVNMGKTQGFNQVLQTPGQQSAGGGATQTFNEALTLPHAGPKAAPGAVGQSGNAGPTTGMFNQVLPLPGQGGGGATAAGAGTTAVVGGAVATSTETKTR